MKYLMIILNLVFWSGTIRADDTKKIADTARLDEVQDRAKRRVYPGGNDETDLKVQVQVINPTRKISPTVEGFSEDPSDD